MTPGTVMSRTGPASRGGTLGNSARRRPLRPHRHLPTPTPQLSTLNSQLSALSSQLASQVPARRHKDAAEQQARHQRHEGAEDRDPRVHT